MRYMTTAFYIILFIVFILFVGKTTITFAPFAFHMEAWRTVIGYILIFLGISFIYVDVRHDIRMELLEEINSELNEIKTQKQKLIDIVSATEDTNTTTVNTDTLSKEN